MPIKNTSTLNMLVMQSIILHETCREISFGYKHGFTNFGGNEGIVAISTCSPTKKSENNPNFCPINMFSEA